jgi:dienelactone hydrolase
MAEERITVKRPIQGQSPLELGIAVHPNKNGIIVVNYPGITGDIDGYSNKYGKQADFVQEKGIGTVVRMGNPYFRELPYPGGMIDNFKFILDYCLKNGKELSGEADPTLYLMGFSAGSSTIAAVASSYSAVEKILLMAPTGDAGQEAIKIGLNKFAGEVYVAIGDSDEIVGHQAGQAFYDLAKSAKVKKLEIIPDCGHQFIGEANGKIMSKAPLWAFAGDTTFPSPDGGKILY